MTTRGHLRCRMTRVRVCKTGEYDYENILRFESHHFTRERTRGGNDARYFVPLVQSFRRGLSTRAPAGRWFRIIYREREERDFRLHLRRVFISTSFHFSSSSFERVEKERWERCLRWERHFDISAIISSFAQASSNIIIISFSYCHERESLRQREVLRSHLNLWENIDLLPLTQHFAVRLTLRGWWASRFDYRDRERRERAPMMPLHEREAGREREFRLFSWGERIISDFTRKHSSRGEARVIIVISLSTPSDAIREPSSLLTPSVPFFKYRRLQSRNESPFERCAMLLSNICRRAERLMMMRHALHYDICIWERCRWEKHFYFSHLGVRVYFPFSPKGALWRQESLSF